MLNSISVPFSFIIFHIFPSLVAADSSAPCYYPSGTSALGYYPCDPTAYVTTCCPQGWTCFSNSLCVVTTPSTSFPNLTLGDVQRGACTNPRWNNAVCGSACLGNGNSAGSLAACPNNFFCCLEDFEAGKCNCSNSGGSFLISDGRFQTIIGESDATFTGSPSYHPPPLPQTTGNTTSIKTSSSNATSITASSGQPTSLSTSTSSPISQPSDITNSVGFKVGISIGVLAFCSLVAFLVWFIIFRKKAAPRPVYQVTEPVIPLQDPDSNPYDQRPEVAQYEDSSEGANVDPRNQFSNTPPVDNPYD